MLDSVPALRSRARLRLCLFSSFSSRGLGVRRVGLDIDLSYGDAKSVWVNHGVLPAWEIGTSYLSIDSSRPSDGRLACEVRDAVWGPRSGASRNLGNDVRASDAGSSTRVFKHPAVIAVPQNGLAPIRVERDDLPEATTDPAHRRRAGISNSGSRSGFPAPMICALMRWS
jgi:hypothetical protein